MRSAALLLLLLALPPMVSHAADPPPPPPPIDLGTRDLGPSPSCLLSKRFSFLIQYNHPDPACQRCQPSELSLRGAGAEVIPGLGTLSAQFGEGDCRRSCFDYGQDDCGHTIRLGTLTMAAPGVHQLTLSADAFDPTPCTLDTTLRDVHLAAGWGFGTTQECGAEGVEIRGGLSAGATVFWRVRIPDFGQTTAVSTAVAGVLEGPPGRKLTQPLRVRALVRDSEGRLAGKAGLQVTFGVTQSPAGGEAAFVDPATAFTDADGFTATEFTLGNAPGDYQVRASCAGCLETPETTFSARASAQEVLSIVTEPEAGDGDGQKGSVGQTLPVRLRARVVSSIPGNLPRPTRIRFSIQSCSTGADLFPAFADTDPLGFASSRLTLGTEPGPCAVRATCEDCGGARERAFSAEAKPIPTLLAELPREDFGESFFVTISGANEAFFFKTLVRPPLRLAASGFPAGGSFRWALTRGADKAALEGDTSAAGVSVRALAPSGSLGDVEVQATYTLGSRATVDIHRLTVQRAAGVRRTPLPRQLCSQLLRLPGLDAAGGPFGALFHYRYLLLDQFGQPMRIPREFGISPVEDGRIVATNNTDPDLGRLLGVLIVGPVSARLDEGRWVDRVGSCVSKPIPAGLTTTTERCVLVTERLVVRERATYAPLEIGAIETLGPGACPTLTPEAP